MANGGSYNITVNVSGNSASDSAALTAQTVSYTHLDVYKRQEQVNTSFLTLAMAHGLDLPIINPNAEAMMAAVASFKAVSYTHLAARLAAKPWPAAAPFQKSAVRGAQQPVHL